MKKIALAVLTVLLAFDSTFCASVLTEPMVTALAADSAFDISALGTADWIMPGVTDKSGGTVLAINGSSTGAPTPGLNDSVGFLIGAPVFAFYDGTSPLFSAGITSHFEFFTSGEFTITAAVRPVPQTLTVFFGASNAGTATSTRVRASLSGGAPADNLSTGYTSFSAKFMRWDYTFSSTTATTLSLLVTKYADYGTSTGIFAAAVAVPEPATPWLLLVGSVACVWMMRRSSPSGREARLKRQPAREREVNEGFSRWSK